MNSRLLDLLIEFDEMGYAPTSPCGDPELCAKEWKNRVREAFKALETENAALRERIDKAVEVLEKLKEEIEPRVYKSFFGFVVQVRTLQENKEIYGTEEDALARLAELKGEKL